MFARVRELLGREKARQYERVADTELVQTSAGSDVCVAELSIQGMTCSACTSAVQTALRAAPGVTHVEVSLLQHAAEVHFDPRKTNGRQLVQVVEDTGFDAALQSVQERHAAADSSSRLQVARLRVGGMTCGACSAGVERTLRGLTGVSTATVSHVLGEAEVSYQAPATPEAMVAAVDDMGFEASLLAVGGEVALLAVSRLAGSSTAPGEVTELLRGLPGVGRTQAMEEAGRVQVWYDPTSTGPRTFLQALSAAGYEAILLDQGDDGSGAAAQAAELERWRGLLIHALVFTVPVFVVSMVLPMMPGSQGVLSAPVLGFRCDELLKWLLATPVQFFVGWCFQVGAWKALRGGRANMDVLVALGTDASYAYSVISILHHRFVQHDAHHYIPTDFFETCAMLITVVILGKYLECAAKGRTSEAIKALLALKPETALLVVLDDGGHVVEETSISSRLVHQGDMLKVLPGGRIPTDGVLVDGSPYIDESMITGESKHVCKAVGDALIGGTINIGGERTGSAFIMQATCVGTNTVLSQIVRLVQRAQLNKAPIQAYADWVASIFVPVIVVLAFITWLAWYLLGVSHAYPDSWLPLGHTHFLFALLFGIAVLVIACPCALGLATPTAVMVGTGVGAQLGILIKGGAALERGYHVDTVIFDKTGTLTLGRPEVVAADVFSADYDLTQVCELSIAVESSTTHPLANAVIAYAEAQLVSPAPHSSKHHAKRALDVTADSSSSSNSSTLHGATSALHQPPTPPNAQQRGFVASFSLDDDHHSGTSSPTIIKRHHHHQQQPRQLGGGSGSSSRCHSPTRAGSSGGGSSSLQLVDIPLSHPPHPGSSNNSSSSTAAGHQRHGQGGGGGQQQQDSSAWHWSHAHSRSSAPSSPKVGGYSSSSSAQHHHGHHNAAGVLGGQPGGSDGGARCSGAGAAAAAPWSPASTPRRVQHLLSNGLLRVSDVQTHPGKGVTAIIPDSAASTLRASGTGGAPAHPAGGLLVVMGNRRLMLEQGVSVGLEAQAFMERHEAAARTVVLLGVNGDVVAALAIADPLKPEARDVVAALQAQAIQVHLLTGDNKKTALAIARQLAIPEARVAAEVLPAGKADVVAELQGRRRVVAMVGDGINDSPALAAADVGIAIGSGTDIAVEAADYVLMQDNLAQVLVALDLARKTFQRIRMNFGWAMVYNTLMVPIAAGALYPHWRLRMPPWVAGGCMVLSSVSVVVSSLLLKQYKPPRHLLRRGMAEVRVQ